MALENVDLSNLSAQDLAQLQRMVAKERAERQESEQIVQAAVNLINTARNLGYSKTVVRQQLSNIVDDVYDTAAAE